MNERQRRKLQRAYALLLAHDRDYGADEYVDEASKLLSTVLGKRASRAAETQVEEEYSGSGMELEDEDA